MRLTTLLIQWGFRLLVYLEGSGWLVQWGSDQPASANQWQYGLLDQVKKCVVIVAERRGLSLELLGRYEWSIVDQVIQSVEQLIWLKLPSHLDCKSSNSSSNSVTNVCQ